MRRRLVLVLQRVLQRLRHGVESWRSLRVLPQEARQGARPPDEQIASIRMLARRFMPPTRRISKFQVALQASRQLRRDITWDIHHFADKRLRVMLPEHLGRLMTHADELLGRQGIEALRQQPNVHDGILRVVGQYRFGQGDERGGAPMRRSMFPCLATLDMG